ncbi:hypothetical protein BKE38_05450 [Pseudoroseomonas deserti]|uniref:Uncharacterized protein n=1 Tax=Teichococcus deserti TaxID=1817963 RepID=A0A1V2H6D9_9PROT|nr:hypothetical protein [Pseudoroseomonas deserti]ONG56671.1 hypothetical protein BKE38_05450 [Pseudoroseomonas deserti]
MEVRDAADAVLALQVARDLGLEGPVTLVSPPGAAAWLGAPLFLATIAAARQQVPGIEVFAVLDCGAAPGLALAALTEGGLGAVVLAPCPGFEAVRGAAAEAGLPLWPAPPPCLRLQPRERKPGRIGPAGCAGRENGPDDAIAAKVARKTGLEAKKMADWWASAPGDSTGRLG